MRITSIRRLEESKYFTVGSIMCYSGPYHAENAKKKVKFLLSKNFTFVVLFHITRKAKLKFLLSKNFTFVRVFLYHTEQNKKKLRAFPKVSNHDHM